MPKCPNCEDSRTTKYEVLGNTGMPLVPRVYVCKKCGVLFVVREDLTKL